MAKKDDDKGPANMVLWDKLFQTPPSRTKSFKRAGGFSGTAIQPFYCVQRMTEEFGPHGQGWGHSEIENKVYTHSDGQAVWMSKIVVWYRVVDQVFTTGPQWGQTMLVVKRSSGGEFIDEEAPKKAVTDGMVKCLSYLGLGGDVHAGMFDDSKYVAEAKVEERKEKDREESDKRRAKKSALAEDGERAEAAEKERLKKKPEEALNNGSDPENENQDQPPPKLDPASYRDKACAEMKMLKTEKAVRNYWATSLKPVLDQFTGSGDEERIKIAHYIHGKIKEQLAKVRSEPSREAAE